MTTPWRSTHLYRSARSKRRHPREKGMRIIRPGDLLIFYLLLVRRIKRHAEPFSKTRKGLARRKARRFSQAQEDNADA